MPWSYANIDWTTTWAGVQGVASVGALWFVVVQVTRDSRARRQRERANLRAATLGLEIVIHNLQRWGTTTAKGPSKLAAQVMLQTGTIGAMRRELEVIALHDLPTESAVELVLSARTALGILVSELEKMAQGMPERPGFLEGHLKPICSIADKLAAEAGMRGRAIIPAPPALQA